MFSRIRVQPDGLIRGLAIASVVFNHAAALSGRPFELGGGMNALIILSGYSFARFVLIHDTAAATRFSIRQFAFHLALATLPLMLIAFVIIGYFDISEIFFYTNIVHMSEIKLLYTWYPQVILQICLFVYALTFISPVFNLFQKSRFISSLFAVVAGFIAYILLKDWQPGGGATRLPQYSFWMFALGWVVLYGKSAEGRQGRLIRIALVLLTALFAFYQFGFQKDVLRPIISVVTVGAILFMPDVVMPKPLARMFLIASQAALTIYLLHLPFIKLFDALHLRPHKTGFHLGENVAAWAFSFFGCIVFWLVASSLTRAWRHETSHARQLSLKVT